MGLFAKIKAAWAARKVVNQMGEIKRGWKTLSFWVTLAGNLVTLAVTLKGMVPAIAGIVAMTALTAVYNILRGAQKSEEAGVRAWWKTTEFWMGIGTEAIKGITVLKAGGVNPEWFGFTSAVLAGAMTIARDLAHKEPT